jgi:hypothetical protein
MAFVPGPNVWQIEIRGTLHTQEYENVIYALRGPEGAGPSDIALAISGWLSSTFDSNFGPELIWDEIYMTDLTTATSPTFSLPLSPVIPGTALSECAPGNVALCVTFRSAGRGRSSRGRNFYGGLPIGNITGNVLDLGAAQAIRDDVEALRGIILSNGWQMVVFSRETGGVPRTVGLAQPVTAIALTNNNIDSQRRRLAGRGQ